MTEPETGIGRVALRVADLDRAAAFYGRVVGLETLDRTEERAALGVDDPCLVLLSRPDAPPRDRAAAGLSHTAIRARRGRPSVGPSTGSRSGGDPTGRRTTA